MSTPAQSDDERDDLNFEREEQLAVLQRKMEVRALLRGGRNRPERMLAEETKTAAPVYLWPKERKK